MPVRLLIVVNVLVLAQYFPPDMGGGSTRASNIVRGLLTKNCNITIIAAFPHYPHGRVPEKYKRKAIVSERFGAAKVYRVWIPALPHNSTINRLFLHFCFVVSSLFALPLVGSIDVIWGSNPNLFCFFPSFVYSICKHAPIVRNVDDLWPEVFYELGYVRSKICRKALDFVAWLSYIIPKAITPISEGYTQLIVSKYNVPIEKVHVIEVGVDTINTLNTDHTGHERFVIMYSGIIGEGYNFEIVLKAAQDLKYVKNIVFIIRGVGPSSSELRRRTKSLNLSNLILNTDFLPRDQLHSFLSSADVFLLPVDPSPSCELGLPTKIFEYQSYGKPIICISDGESTKYIKKTECGLTVKQGDFEGFKDAVLKLYSNREFASKLGSNGRQSSLTMTKEKIGGLMYDVFSSVE